jgi:hypothetical protein
MHLLWRRYTRSNYAPPWFYWIMAGGFAALAVWSAIQTDWVVFGVALAMVPVTFAGARVLRRVAVSEEMARQEQLQRERREKDNDE